VTEPSGHDARRRRTRRRFRITSASRLVPNAITVLSLGAGMTSIRFALDGHWKFAVGAIATAAVLDTLDGRMARLLKSTSKFGAELDSLADFIAFGVAPAMILYLWSTNGLSSVGWTAALFFATCMALRLARFNVMSDADLPPYAYRFFTGVPAPAAAGLGLLPLVASFEVTLDVLSSPYLVAAWQCCVGLLMVSSLPTYSFKGLRVPQKLVLPLLIGVGAVVAAAASAPWTTIALIVLAYLAGLPFSYRSYLQQRRMSAEQAAVRDEEVSVDGSEDPADVDPADVDPADVVGGDPAANVADLSDRRRKP
jgi:CDP-diacylglycerol--serine O-phosphatidyltransferase